MEDDSSHGFGVPWEGVFMSNGYLLLGVVEGVIVV